MQGQCNAVQTLFSWQAMKALLCAIFMFDACSAFIPNQCPPEVMSREHRRSLSFAGAFHPVDHPTTRILSRPRQLITPTSPFSEAPRRGLRMTVDGVAGKDDGEKEGDASGQEQDPRIYTVRISRATGIDWGSDISFSWVYVRDLYPSGAAANCGQISVGDQLIAINDIKLAGAPFDAAMDALIGARDPEVEFTFFRGSTEDLKRAVGAQDPPEEITVTVKQKGRPDITLKTASGANLRNLLTDNGINVYQSITRWTNCKGKQLCGTCIVEINEGLENCTVRSLDESSTLRDNPANYRLSCVTNMYDDVTVTVFPPVGAAQWTR